MAINPAMLLRLMNVRKEFEGRHPRVVSFFNHELFSSMEEGTVLEMTVTRPGRNPVTTNMKITAEDLAMFEELKNLKG